MNKITLEIKWKLVSNKETKTLEVRQGISSGELLDLLDIFGERNQVLMLYNGRPVFLDEPLERDGEVVLMPLLAGG